MFLKSYLWYRRPPGPADRWRRCTGQTGEPLSEILMSLCPKRNSFIDRFSTTGTGGCQRQTGDPFRSCYNMQPSPEWPQRTKWHPSGKLPRFSLYLCDLMQIMFFTFSLFPQRKSLQDVTLPLEDWVEVKLFNLFKLLINKDVNINLISKTSLRWRSKHFSDKDKVLLYYIALSPEMYL